MPIRLRARPDMLPLGFEAGKHLTQERRAFTDAGEPLYGSDLNDRLAGEGFGPHTVTFSGKYVVPGSDITQLHDWSRTVTLFGPLDKDSLARVVYGVSRNLMENYLPEDTIPELYITEIDIGEEEAPPEQPPRRRPPHPPPEPTAPPRKKPKRPPPKPRKPKTVYVDTKTGKYVSESTYNRSRARLPKGKRGRYVKRRK